MRKLYVVVYTHSDSDIEDHRGDVMGYAETREEAEAKAAAYNEAHREQWAGNFDEDYGPDPILEEEPPYVVMEAGPLPTIEEIRRHCRGYA